MATVTGDSAPRALGLTQRQNDASDVSGLLEPHTRSCDASPSRFYHSCGMGEGGRANAKPSAARDASMTSVRAALVLLLAIWGARAYSRSNREQSGVATHAPQVGTRAQAQARMHTSVLPAHHHTARAYMVWRTTSAGEPACLRDAPATRTRVGSDRWRTCALRIAMPDAAQLCVCGTRRHERVCARAPRVADFARTRTRTHMQRAHARTSSYARMPRGPLIRSTARCCC